MPAYQVRPINPPFHCSYGSAPHNSLGLQVAISGRADVVQADVAAHLSEWVSEPNLLAAS